MGGYHTKIQNMIFTSIPSKDERSKKKKFSRQTFPELHFGRVVIENADGFSVKGKFRNSHRFYVNKVSLVEGPQDQITEEVLAFRETGHNKDSNELKILLRRRSVTPAAGGRKRRRGGAGRESLRLTAGRHRWQVERFSDDDAAALQLFLRHGLVSCLMTVAHLRTLHCPQITKGWSSCPDMKSLPDSAEPLPDQGEPVATSSKPAPVVVKANGRTRHFTVQRVAEEEIMGDAAPGSVGAAATIVASDAASAAASSAGASTSSRAGASGENSASSGNEKKLHVHWEDLED